MTSTARLWRRLDHRLDPRDVGWNLGRSTAPAGVDLWVPWDRTAGVIGPQGSGKTLDLLTPALLGAPGAALVTLTKPDDLLLTFTARSTDGRPCVVLDPFGLVPGLPELVWDPIAGCVDPIVAERRAKAFTAGTIKGAVAEGYGDQAARFYAAEAAKVIQAYFHAAALTNRTLDAVLEWVADPQSTVEPSEILRTHPQAAQFWHGLLGGALHGDERTAGNTTTTVQQALSLFFQEPMRRRCVPGPGRPTTNIGKVLAGGGTIYMLGREDPYASASPLMTALAEHVLDTALGMAQHSPWGRLCPPMLACLDELPSTAPLPTLRTRMANERALGLSFIWAAQNRAQLDSIFGQAEARAVLGLTNNLVLFGGSKDVAFNQEVSDLLGKVRVGRVTWNTGHRGGRTYTGEDIPVLTGSEIRQIKERHALVISENGKPIMVRLHRCIDGHAGNRLLADQTKLRKQVGGRRRATITPEARTTAALATARQHGLIVQEHDQ
ncbi:MAG: TraM recognition domain-containing protein [Ornithinimicrobium sp.]